ncbi:MAG: phasin family protein [Endomicrobium sp.]|jgi:polyhydroxyalkanoate synthesis regulator phasin|nr:phasin family protein [Endomicrobium sp.]
MADLKTAFYASVGLALKGKQKVEQVAKKFVKDNKIEAIEGKKFIDKAVKHAETTKNEISKKIQETVKTTINRMGFITHKEANNLKNEIKKLKTQLQKSKKLK